MLIKQSTATKALMFLMIDSADNVSPKTGLTPTVTLSKNGAAFASPAGAVSEVAHGWYKVAANATDSNTLGQLVLHATASGAVATDALLDVVAFDPDDAAGLGLSRIDAAISSRSTYAGGAVASVTAGVTLASAEHTAISGTDVPAALTAQGYTTVRAGYLDAAISSRNAVAPDNALIALIAGYLDTEVAAIKAKTDQLAFSGGNVNSAAQNLPSDYQQRTAAVTLPTTAPAGYGGTGATAAAVRAEMDANSTILAAILGSITDADIVMASGGLTATMSVYGSGASHSSPLFTVSLSRAATTDPFSLNRN